MRNRHTPRVLLRRPRRGRLDDGEVLVLEMGLGGAKFEHPARLEVGFTGTFSCGPLATTAVVRHSILLPTPTGFVFHSGVEFSDLGPTENALLLDLLVHEAKEQVVEWESNLAGQVPLEPKRGHSLHSSVAPRFISLKLLPSGWDRSVTADPNQPLNGVTMVDGTPEEEIKMLRETYEAADQPMRELMRRVATVAILERLRDQG